MEKNKITNAIFSKKTRDYTFVALFLIVFSVFIMAAIRPSLSTATSLKKEEADLKKVDSMYESKISNINLVQSQVEANRDNLYLLNEAVSEYPQVNKMVEDLKKIADKNNFLIKKANIADVNLSQTQKKMDEISLIVEGKTTFPNLLLFTNDLFDQRRLKLIKQMKIETDKEASEEGQLIVTMIINGFYL